MNVCAASWWQVSRLTFCITVNAAFVFCLDSPNFVLRPAAEKIDPEHLQTYWTLLGLDSKRSKLVLKRLVESQLLFTDGKLGMLETYAAVENWRDHIDFSIVGVSFTSVLRPWIALSRCLKVCRLTT